MPGDEVLAAAVGDAVSQVPERARDREPAWLDDRSVRRDPNSANAVAVLVGDEVVLAVERRMRAITAELLGRGEDKASGVEDDALRSHPRRTNVAAISVDAVSPDHEEVRAVGGDLGCPLQTVGRRDWNPVRVKVSCRLQQRGMRRCRSR